MKNIKNTSEIIRKIEEEGFSVFRYSRGYDIYTTDHPHYCHYGFVSYGGDHLLVVDVSEYEWEDQEEFLDCVEEELEKRVGE